MTIHDREISDVTVVDIDGRITIQEGADIFQERLQRLVHLGQPKLVLNLDDVPYIDSTALGVIVRAHTTVTRQGGSLKLLHVKGHVRALLAVTKLLTVFETFDSESEAVASFGTYP